MEELNIDDITLFKNYLTDNEQDFNNIHIPYFIGSPTHIYKVSEHSKKNDALVPIVVLIKKGDNSYHFKEVMFNWSSIDLLQTYSRINPSGQLEYLGNTEKYSELFHEQEIEIDIKNVKEITLEDIVLKHKYYRKLSTELLNKYKNENFFIFSANNKNYIVPAIEVVRYFYCFSDSDSLKQAALHPSGLGTLVKDVKKDPESNRYDFYLESISETADHKKAFYFHFNKNYLSKFNSIFYNYKKGDVINTSFPAENTFKVICKTLKLPNSSHETYLITRFVATDLFNNFFKNNNIDLHVFHPLRKKKEKKTGKRDPNKDRKRKVPKNRPRSFNDQLGTSAEIPLQVVEDIPSKDYFPDNDWKAKIEITGQRVDRGGRVVEVPVNVSESSTQDGKGDKKGTVQKITTSSKQPHIENYPDPLYSETNKDINNSVGLVQEFRLHGFMISSINVYDFPDKSDIKKMVISYKDKEKKNKRQYIIIGLSKGDYQYVYLDVEAKKDKKEILILKNQSEDMAHKCVYQQVFYGNHKWLVKSSFGLEEETDYIRVRHSATAKLIVENIIDKFKI